jgi:hypothetical protein
LQFQTGAVVADLAADREGDFQGFPPLHSARHISTQMRVMAAAPIGESSGSINGLSAVLLGGVTGIMPRRPRSFRIGQAPGVGPI